MKFILVIIICLCKNFTFINECITDCVLSTYCKILHEIIKINFINETKCIVELSILLPDTLFSISKTYIRDHVERKVLIYGKGKGKLLPKIEEISRGKGTQKHTETYSKYFDGHGHLSQSEESKCM